MGRPSAYGPINIDRQNYMRDTASFADEILIYKPFWQTFLKSSTRSIYTLNYLNIGPPKNY